MEIDKKDPIFPPMTFTELGYKEPIYPDLFPDGADYNTNAQSYYDKLAKDGRVLMLLAHRIWKYDATLDASLQHIQEVLQNYSDILDGKIEDFDEIIFKLTKEWIDENLESIFSQAVKMVWFGLDDTGHFIAVIPESWDEIDFDTTNEGELLLRY